jgi:hypothetical protein
MKLNQNSISARIYRWFYMTDEMPQNLCPYFWKLVIAYILLIPCGILYLPITILRTDVTETGERLALGFFSWIAILGALLMIFPITYFFYGFFPNGTTYNSWQLIGIALWVGAFALGISYGIAHLSSERRRKREIRNLEYMWDEYGVYVKNPNYKPYEKNPNIIIEFIKAKYNRYCPKIEWNTEEK